MSATPSAIRDARDLDRRINAALTSGETGTLLDLLAGLYERIDETVGFAKAAREVRFNPDAYADVLAQCPNERQRKAVLAEEYLAHVCQHQPPTSSAPADDRVLRPAIAAAIERFFAALARLLERLRLKRMAERAQATRVRTREHGTPATRDGADVSEILTAVRDTFGLRQGPAPRVPVAFRYAPGEGKGPSLSAISAEDLRVYAESILADWPASARLRVCVAASPKELPGDVRAAFIRSIGEDGRCPMGIYDPRTARIALVTEAMEGPEDVESTLWHEWLHMAMDTPTQDGHPAAEHYAFYLEAIDALRGDLGLVFTDRHRATFKARSKNAEAVGLTKNIAAVQGREIARALYNADPQTMPETLKPIVVRLLHLYAERLDRMDYPALSRHYRERGNRLTMHTRHDAGAQVNRATQDFAQDIPPRQSRHAAGAALAQRAHAPRDGAIYALPLDTAIERARELMPRVEALYERGELQQAETLDAALTVLLDRIEHGLSDDEADREAFSPPHGDPRWGAGGVTPVEDSETGFERELAVAYHRAITDDVGLAVDTSHRAGLAAYLRDVINEIAPLTVGAATLRPLGELSDDTVIAAAQEAYEATLKRRAQPTSDGDPVAEIAARLQALQNQRAAATGRLDDLSVIAPFARRAYHGSPHRFSEFSLSAVGTGEGANAFGWGIYFAGRRAIAEHYRELLSQAHAERDAATEFLLANPELAEEWDRSVNAFADEKGIMPPDFAMSAMLLAQTVNGIPPDFVTQELAERLRAAYRTQPREGTLYEVEIPDDDELLDWHRPMTEQPERVQRAVRAMGGEARRLAFTHDGYGNYPTGGAVYHALADHHAGGRAHVSNILEGGSGDEGMRGASMQLADAGIPGLRYLDAATRGTAGGELLDVSPGSDGAWRAKIKVYDRAGLDFTTPTNAITTSPPFTTEAEARTWARSKIRESSYNYVIWDVRAIRVTDVHAPAAPHDPRGGDADLIQPFARRAYHGSPHRFSEFSLDAVGSGEGAHAFGWGLYFAGKREVAEWYHRALDRQWLILDGEAVDHDAFVAAAEQSYSLRREDASHLFYLVQGAAETPMRAAEMVVQRLTHDAALPADEFARMAEALPHLARGIESLPPNPAPGERRPRVAPVGGIRVTHDMTRDEELALFDIQSRAWWQAASGHSPDAVFARVREELERTVAVQRERLDAIEAGGGFESEDRVRRVLAEAETALAVMERYDLRLHIDEYRGGVYTVEIPDDDDLLDWDRPISEQPTAVRDRVEPLLAAGLTASDELHLVTGDGKALHWSEFFEDLEDATPKTRDKVARIMGDGRGGATWMTYGDFERTRLTGADLYRDLSNELGGARAASNRLNELGIPGLRYRDRFSRFGAAAEPTHNYVIWDADAVSVEAVNDELRRAEAQQAAHPGREPGDALDDEPLAPAPQAAVRATPAMG